MNNANLFMRCKVNPPVLVHWYVWKCKLRSENKSVLPRWNVNIPGTEAFTQYCGSLLVTCNFKLTGKVTLNILCSWKPQVHTQVNHILEHHVKALVKNQKCIMRKKKFKVETLPRNFLLSTAFSKTLARCCTFKTESYFHWVAYLLAPVKQLGGPGTALTGLMFFTQKPRL